MSIIPQFRLLMEEYRTPTQLIKVEFGDAMYLMGPREIEHVAKYGNMPNDFHEIANFGIAPVEFAVVLPNAASRAERLISGMLTDQLAGVLSELKPDEKALLGEETRKLLQLKGLFGSVSHLSDIAII